MRALALAFTVIAIALATVMKRPAHPSWIAEKAVLPVRADWMCRANSADRASAEPALPDRELWMQTANSADHASAEPALPDRKLWMQTANSADHASAATSAECESEDDELDYHDCEEYEPESEDDDLSPYVPKVTSNNLW